MLKRKWFRELGIAGRGKEYFYNKGEYEEYREIMKRQNLAEK